MGIESRGQDRSERQSHELHPHTERRQATFRMRAPPGFRNIRVTLPPKKNINEQTQARKPACCFTSVNISIVAASASVPTMTGIRRPPLLPEKNIPIGRRSLRFPIRPPRRWQRSWRVCRGLCRCALSAARSPPTPVNKTSAAMRPATPPASVPGLLAATGLIPISPGRTGSQ